MAERYPGDSVFDEPQFREKHFVPDAAESEAERLLRRERDGEDERAESSIWDEPAVSLELGPPRAAEDIDYAAWLRQGLHRTTWAQTWTITILIALLAGPWAVLGVLWRGGGMTLLVILRVVIVGPVAEEVMKMAIPFYLVEKRPFLFRSPAQIIICALAGGLAFAAIENVLYLYLPGRHPSEALIAWRWTVCTALHMGCTLIVGLGVLRVWRDVWRRGARARLELAFPTTALAVGLHGAYNLFAVLLSASGYPF
jgi:hypothetical protein